MKLLFLATVAAVVVGTYNVFIHDVIKIPEITCKWLITIKRETGTLNSKCPLKVQHMKYYISICDLNFKLEIIL